MGDPLFSDPDGIELRQVDDDEEFVELVTASGAAPVLLSRAVALRLADALRRWAAPAGVPAAEGFLVYYQHEYVDREGQPVAIPELGEPNAEQELTWYEPTVADVRSRVAAIGAAVSALHERSQGFERDEDHGRAWISIFRLPEDVRVWKGYWDELAETPDDELTS